MSEKRLGMIFVWYQLLQELEFRSIVDDVMGTRLWSGWGYGDMATALVCYKLFAKSDPFSSFIEDYAIKELLGKEQWEFDYQHIDALFESHWNSILQRLSLQVQVKEEVPPGKCEWVRVNKDASILISCNGGFPVGCTTGQVPEEAFRVIRKADASVDFNFVASRLINEEVWNEQTVNGKPILVQMDSGKIVNFLENQDLSIRTIFILEEQLKRVLPPDMEIYLNELKKAAWEKGYDEGILWLNRELRQSPLFASGLIRKLKLLTYKKADRVAFHWSVKSECQPRKKRWIHISTNLPSEYSVEWLLDTLNRREEWKNDPWLKKIKNPLPDEKNQLARTALLSICWVLDYYLGKKMKLVNISPDSLNDETVSRIRWRDGQIHSPLDVSRLMGRLFPAD